MALLLGRFVIFTLVYGLTYFPIPGLMAKVFIIQSAMPVITQSAIIAGAYGGSVLRNVYGYFNHNSECGFHTMYMVLISGI